LVFLKMGFDFRRIGPTYHASLIVQILWLINRRHPYEWCGENNCEKWSWNQEEMDGQSWPSNVNFTKDHVNSTISGQKIFTTIWDYSQPPLHFQTPCMSSSSLSHVRL
jgi:hypothetical protein